MMGSRMSSTVSSLKKVWPGNSPSNVQVHRLRSVAAFVQSATEPRLCSAAETAFDLLASANRWRPDTRAFAWKKKNNWLFVKETKKCQTWKLRLNRTKQYFKHQMYFFEKKTILGFRWLMPREPTALMRPIWPMVFGFQIAFGSTTRAPAKGNVVQILESKWMT